MSANIKYELAERNATILELRPVLIKYFHRKCGNSSEAEDLAQDVILKALANAHWSSPEEAKGYIFKIAVNRWKDRGRRKLTRGHEVEWQEDGTQTGFEEPSIDRVLSGQEQLHQLEEALLELRTRTRDIFLLSRLEHMRQAEIARSLGISVSAVEKHMIKAVTHLAKRLKRDA